MNTLKVLRLSSGEELLGEVTETVDTYTIKNPVQLIVSMAQNRGVGGDPVPTIGFAPWMFSMYTTLKKDNPNGITILKQHVLFAPGVTGDIEDEYNKLFAKVVIPKTSLILP